MRRDWQGAPPKEFVPHLRARLLDAARVFILAASRLDGVRRISLLGSIVTDKPDPKDIDLLVQIADHVDLHALARLGRQLKGAAQQFNHSADIFLCDEAGQYLGRTCKWRECHPGIRVACEALHCGRRQYLYDDLGVLRLNPSLTTEPPVDVYPTVGRRRRLTEDVEQMIRELIPA